jgi:hypothetical protein
VRGSLPQSPETAKKWGYFSGPNPAAGVELPEKTPVPLEIYTLPIPENQRATVEKLSVLMANDGKSDQKLEGLAVATKQIQ